MVGSMGRVVIGSSKLRSAIEKIETVRVEGERGGFLPELREALGFDAMIYLQPIERAAGWVCEAFEADGVANPVRMRRACTEYFEATAQPIPWLDLRHPPENQANRAIDLQALVGSERYRNSSLYGRIIAPTELAEHFVARLLVCEGSNLLAWICGFSQDAITVAQLESFTRVASPVGERVRIERLLGNAPRVRAALEETLQQIGAPALLVDERLRVLEMNRAARELLSTRREDVLTSIAAVRARKAPALPFTITLVSANGQPEQFLAVMRPRSAESRMSLSVTLSANRWKLTQRQAEVLRLLVRGDSNAQIATALAISPRAAELHIAAVFERAGVDSRPELVAAVLLA